MNTNLAIYLRVSKDEVSSKGVMQDPNNQLIPLLEYCKNRGLEPKKIYTDYASGGNSNRPQFQELLSQVRQGHINTILVWSLDRFSREGISNTLGYLKDLKSYGCRFISYQEPLINTEANPFIADLMISILSWVGAYEKQRISDRTKAGLQRAKQKGTKLGRPKKYEL